MRRFIASLSSAALLASLLAGPAFAAKPDDFDSNGNVIHSVSDAGFDQFGYNRTARIFSGTGLSWCLALGYTVSSCESYLGSSANDRLVMKWNAEWDRGNAEDWLKPPYAAWLTNEWNGMVPGGDGYVWHYKFVWVEPCGADYTPLPDGGYCIWGQFEVIMDQGAWAGGHAWFALATPNGLGGQP